MRLRLAQIHELYAGHYSQGRKDPMPQLVRKNFLLTAGACLLLALLFAPAAPNLLRRRMVESERSAPQTVRAIDMAVKVYIAEHGTTPPALSSLKGRLTPALSCDAPACDFIGYRFQYTASSGSPHYFISAQPITPQTAARSYYLDETGLLRYTEESHSATSSDPLLNR